MDAIKLKMKIGDHEFEAEGPQDLVQQQFAAFRELVTAAPTQRQTPADTQQPRDAGDGTNALALERIMRVDQRIVSLTARGESIEDEVLLVLLGQQRLRQNDSVTGAEILGGLRQTRGTVNRIDYQLQRMADTGMVISVGAHRARRYRMTNQGAARAVELARALIATVA